MTSPLLAWKVLRIEVAIKQILRSRGIEPHVWSFGAFYLDPKFLVFVVGVQTDAEKERLKSDPVFSGLLKNLLSLRNWPSSAREHVVFDIESQETVDRETNGNWWYHYK
jgi:hypothetical protein